MSKRRIATIVGILILTAYSMLIGEATDSKLIILVVDIISGLSVIGIAIFLYPLFKRYNKGLSVGYISLKLLEGLLMIAGGIFFLFDSTQEMRSLIYGDIHTYVFIVGAFIFYYLLFISRMVPRFISIWGGIAIFSLLVITILRIFDLSNPVIESFLILIITNEIVLSLWLLIKGFNQDSVKDSKNIF